MARRVGLQGMWELTGYAPGATTPEVACACPLPGTLAQALRQAGLREAEDRSGEWAFLRRWVLTRLVEMPKEPKEGHSEKYHLHLSGVRGAGEVRVDGRKKADLAPQLEVDLSDCIQNGACRVEIEFYPFVPSNMAGEGEAWPCAILDAPYLAATAFARYLSFTAQGEGDGTLRIRAEIEGFSAGRVRFLYRLLLGDELALSQVCEMRLGAYRQKVVHTLFLPDAKLWPGEQGRPPLYRLHAVIERGGARCDMEEVDVGFRSLTLQADGGHPSAAPCRLVVNGRPLPLYGAGCQRLPTPEQLTLLRDTGFTVLALRQGAPDAFYTQCDKLGLLVWLLLPEGELPRAEGAIRLLLRHPCAGPVGAFGLRFANGMPADERHGAVRHLAQLAEAARLPLLGAPSGPFDPVPKDLEGKGYAHTVLGPCLTPQAVNALRKDDACLRVDVGAVEEAGEAGDYHKAECVKRAVELFRAHNTGFTLCALGGPEALFAPDGAPLPALYALTGALAPLGLSVDWDGRPLYPGALLDVGITLLNDGPARPLVVEAKLYGLDGEPLREGAWSVLAQRGATDCARFAVQLPFKLTEAIVLRVSAQDGQRVLAVNDTAILCGASWEETPKAQISLAQEQGACYAVNTGRVAAIGVVLPGSSPAYTVLLPGERVALGQEEAEIAWLNAP